MLELGVGVSHRIRNFACFSFDVQRFYFRFLSRSIVQSSVIFPEVDAN